MTDYQTLMNPYTYNNVQYINGFPMYWAMYHAPGTGPIHCQQCRRHGMVDNIFVGYCDNCCNIYNNIEPVGRGESAPLNIPYYVPIDVIPYIQNTFYTYQEEINQNEISRNDIVRYMNFNINMINNNLNQI